MAIDQSAEIARLRATVRDLLALATIPEAWVGREPPAIATDLADLLIESLELNFAFVRLCDPLGAQVAEVTRGNSSTAFSQWLDQNLAAFGQVSTKGIVTSVGGLEEPCCGIVIPIGVNSERGIVAGASDRPDFPDEIDQQLLSVAANNAATAFQNAFLINELRTAQELLRDNERELRKARDQLEIKVAERTAELRQSERELLDVLDFAPQLIAMLGPNRERLYANQGALDYLGISLDEWRKQNTAAEVHPDDRERWKSYADRAMSNGSAYELELRVCKLDGSYRWFLARYRPVRGDQGQVVRWYVACTDIEDRKRAEEKLRQENVTLREEIDKASMFEEIVGTSTSLKAVLSRVSKVAASDSTVLITGETGTGKELIARAVHKRSSRSERAFVSVNCAALAPSLITSELFGYEKGAFTGATQRRPGRFEVADGGTIFLDEVGELSPDIQVALLRVLQEHEFERVGGAQLVRVDVRVIAATNRDLKAAVASGTFRQDLFYRLNVFPIEVPALRERKDDILMLVEYFVERYASRAGKNFHSIDRNTLDLLQSYDWPGNVRELQNIIERSVILSSGEVFSVDEPWLSKESFPRLSRPEAPTYPDGDVQSRSEREIIEAALAKTRGRVSGPSGAAASLGIPPSTLDHRIKVLKINKTKFKYR